MVQKCAAVGFPLSRGQETSLVQTNRTRSANADSRFEGYSGLGAETRADVNQNPSTCRTGSALGSLDWSMYNLINLPPLFRHVAVAS